MHRCLRDIADADRFAFGLALEVALLVLNLQTSWMIKIHPPTFETYRLLLFGDEAALRGERRKPDSDGDSNLYALSSLEAAKSPLRCPISC